VQALHLVEAAENEIRARFAEDPWESAGLLLIGRIEPWALWLDSRPGGSALITPHRQARDMHRAAWKLRCPQVKHCEQGPASAIPAKCVIIGIDDDCGGL
jgi:hypothetical protein